MYSGNDTNAYDINVVRDGLGQKLGPENLASACHDIALISLMGGNDYFPAIGTISRMYV